MQIVLLHEENTSMVPLSEEEVRTLINHIGPSLGSGDHTYPPVYPEGRKDVCVVRRMAEDGQNYGFDTIYFLSKLSDGSITYREVKNSRSSKDYILIDEVQEKEDDTMLLVKLSSSGSYSGRPWEASIKISFRDGEIRISDV